MKDVRRHLLATTVVDYEIGVTDGAAAAKIQARIKVGWCRLTLSNPC